MQARLNPGNVSVRLGKTLELYEMAVAQSQIITAANLVDVMADYVSVFVADDLVEYEQLPGFRYGDARPPAQVWRDLRKRLRWVLALAAKNKVYAWLDPSLGDSSALDKDDAKQENGEELVEGQDVDDVAVEA